MMTTKESIKLDIVWRSRLWIQLHFRLCHNIKLISIHTDKEGAIGYYRYLKGRPMVMIKSNLGHCHRTHLTQG